MARIASTVADLIGGTPLVRINHVAGDGVDVVAKVEAFNPASSVKDRIARSIIDAAEASGALAPGGTIVEATSGNTGIALSMVGAARGYKVVIVMPASMSVERRAIVRAFGAELVLTDPKGGVSAAVAEAERIASERPGAIIASQFTNPANPAAHVAHTGEEIWADTDGQVDVFVAGVGTGGTISGVAKVLKEKNPNVRIIAIQPTESPLLTGGTPGPRGHLRRDRPGARVRPPRGRRGGPARGHLLGRCSGRHRRRRRSPRAGRQEDRHAPSRHG